jgi:PUB domain
MTSKKEENDHGDDMTNEMNTIKEKNAVVGTLEEEEEEDTDESSGKTVYMTLQLTMTALPGAPRIPLELYSEPTTTTTTSNSGPTCNDNTVVAAAVPQPPPHITCDELRQRISERTTIPITVLKLIYRGRLIVAAATTQPSENATTTKQNVITDYQLENGSVIHCMGKPSNSCISKNNNINVSNTTTTSTPTVVTTATNTTAVTTTTTTSSSAAVAAEAAAGTTGTVPVAAVVQPTSSSSSVSLPDALTVMRRSNSIPIYRKCIQTIQKMLHNIIQHPQEAKYRTIKVNNPAFLKQFHTVIGALPVLQACGFVYQTSGDASSSSSMPTEAATTTVVGQYTMIPSPEVWPKLLQAKQMIDQTLQQLPAAAVSMDGVNPTTTNTTTTTTMPSSLFPSSSNFLPPFMGQQQQQPDMMNLLDPSRMQQEMTNLMSNPQQYQAMLQVRHDDDF